MTFTSLQASRKSRYPEDFGWNLQSLVTNLLTHIRERHTEETVRKANRNIAEFVKVGRVGQLLG